MKSVYLEFDEACEAVLGPLNQTMEYKRRLSRLLKNALDANTTDTDLYGVISLVDIDEFEAD